ncbi:MAG: universal stress protein [Gemmatimonadales bacterium]
MPAYQTILVPLDGSEFAEQALPLAERLARQTGANLHLLMVHVPIPGWYTAAEVAALSPTLEQEARQREELYLDGVASRLKRERGVPVSCSLLEGNVAAALSEYAVTIGADLVVMTTHGRSGLDRVWLGSIADKLIRRLTIPLLLVRPDETGKGVSPLLQRILVPMDGSALAESVLEKARAVARLTGAEFILGMIVEPVPVLLPTFPYPVEVSTESPEHRELAARRYLEKIKAQLRGEGFKVRTRVVLGDKAAKQIVEIAEEEKCDLIAIATHGAGGLDRLMFGSVTDRVVRSSQIPILVLHPAGNPDAVREVMAEAGVEQG